MASLVQRFWGGKMTYETKRMDLECQKSLASEKKVRPDAAKGIV